MAEPIPHPKRPPRTPSRRSSFFASDGRAETDSYFWEARTPLRTILMQFVAEEVVYAVGPVRPPHSAPNTNYHLLGWWSTDRPRREATPAAPFKVRFEVGHISVFLPPATLAVDNGRAPHYRRAPRGGCCSGGRSLRFLSAEFWARNH